MESNRLRKMRSLFFYLNFLIIALTFFQNGANGNQIMYNLFVYFFTGEVAAWKI
ncbi:hypothetical protein T472_0208290 [Youngiibacter fragilis 232.1]|uniref:Uncharacterized protein n=1 Tax=Youngiibacter fragilis 232.1 TaxID=994573 RepID=V4F302_9CLOT|nr:hypothetical protein T472_0208290 [Youngiibacter fragilis 232.1]